MNRLVIAYADKVVLGLAALWLTGAASGLAIRGPDEGMRADLSAALGALDAHMRSGATAVPDAASPGFAAALRLSLDPTAVDAAPLFPAWVMERRPGFLFDVPPPPKAPELTHTAPSNVVADASARGRIAVRWEAGAATRLLVSVTLERRVDGGEWVEIATDLAPTVTARVDEAVRPSARYEYRVVATARIDEDDPQVREWRRHGGDGALDAALARRESEPSPAVETPLELFVVPRSVQVAADPREGTAYVVVHRWDRAAGKFVARSFTLKVGDRVGEGAHDTGAVLEAVGESNGALWVELRDASTGAVRTEDSRRDRLPPELRGR
jgi:hypothetical protein